MLKLIHRDRPIVVVITYYVTFILFSTLILLLPFIYTNGQSVSFLEAFFTSNSAIATTGLTVFDYTTTFNYLGWLVLIILFNIGGMGIIVLNTMLIFFLGKKIGFKNRYLAKMDYNQSNERNIVTVLKGVVGFFLTFEIIGTLLLYLKMGYMFENPIDRFMNALFLSASAISGSGFYNSVPYANDYVVQWIVMILMIFSFIGYPVIMDLYFYLKSKLIKTNEKYEFSLFTKIVVKVNIITVVAFALFFFVTEYHHSMENYSLIEKIHSVLYISISTKSVGLNLFSNINDWMPVTLFVQTFFMLIGGSPSSACGGIKVTAIYFAYLHIKSTIKGKHNVVINKNIIPRDTILRSFLLITTFVGISVISTIIIAILNSNIPLNNIWYDVVSGFTTTGFSTGALMQMDQFSIFIISVLMGIGRIGILNIMGIFHNKNNEISRVSYVEKDIAI